MAEYVTFHAKVLERFPEETSPTIMIDMGAGLGSGWISTSLEVNPPDGPLDAGKIKACREAAQGYGIDGRVTVERDALAYLLHVFDLRAVELDPPICWQQFPDGSVPGNVRECAEGWRDHYEALFKRSMEDIAALREELETARSKPESTPQAWVELIWRFIRAAERMPRVHAPDELFAVLSEAHHLMRRAKAIEAAPAESAAPEPLDIAGPVFDRVVEAAATRAVGIISRRLADDV